MDDKNAEVFVEQREKHVRFLLDEESSTRRKQQYRKTPRKLRSGQTLTETAEDRSTIEQTFKRVIQLMEDAKKLKMETKQLMGDYFELGKRFQSLDLNKKELDDEVDRYIQDIDEIRYLNGLIQHLEEADRTMRYEPCHLVDCSVDKACLRQTVSVSEV